ARRQPPGARIPRRPSRSRRAPLLHQLRVAPLHSQERYGDRGGRGLPRSGAVSGEAKRHVAWRTRRGRAVGCVPTSRESAHNPALPHPALFGESLRYAEGFRGAPGSGGAGTACTWNRATRAVALTLPKLLHFDSTRMTGNLEAATIVVTQFLSGAE